MSESDIAELEMMRLARLEDARRLKYHRQPYAAEDMLIAREPNDGRPFDTSRFRLIKGGWDHDHCYICTATISPGDAWWAAEPPDKVGLCPDCHAQLFGT
jgi:hypothetical protein